MKKTDGTSSIEGDVKLFIVNGALMLAGVFNLVWGSYQAFEGNQQLAITCLTAGLLLFLAATIDRFELLKGFGIEAKTRRLEKVLTEAGVTLDQLRHIAEITSRSIVSLTSGAGRVGSAPSTRSNAETIEEVRATLQKLETDPAKIRAILEPWVRVTLFDAMQVIAKQIRSELTAVQQAANAEAMAIQPPRSPEDEVRYASLIARGVAAAEFNKVRLGDPGAWPREVIGSRFTQIVTEMPVLDETTRASIRKQVEEWLPRFDHLIEHQSLQDPESWFAVR
jgi:hypothetical protein